MCKTIINPDGMTVAELYRLIDTISKHPKRVAAFCFPDNPRGRVAAIRHIKHYCWNMMTAINLRIANDTERADFYYAICDSIYAKLPAWAQW